MSAAEEGLRWLLTIMASKKMGTGERLMADNYNNLDTYIKTQLPNPPETQETIGKVAAAWYSPDKKPPEFYRVLNEEEVKSLKSDDRTMYTKGLLTCDKMLSSAKIRFSKLIRAANAWEQELKQEKESAPENLYRTLLNSINAFRAVKPAPPGGDWNTSKTRLFFTDKTIHAKFIEAIQGEIGESSIDLKYMLFRAKSVLAINIIMDLVDYPLGIKNDAWSKVSYAVSQIDKPYSTQYLKILATFLVHGAAAVNKLDKSQVQFPTLILDDTRSLVTDIHSESRDFKLHWSRSLYALSFRDRATVIKASINNGSKTPKEYSQVMAYLDKDYYWWQTYPARKEQKSLDPLCAHIHEISNANINNASAAVSSVAAAAGIVPIEPSAAGVGSVEASIAIRPSERSIANSAAILVAAEKAAAEQAAAAEKAAANAATLAAEKAAEKAAAFAARQAEAIKQFSVKPSGCFGLGCFGRSRKGGRRRLKKHRKTRRRSKKRSTA
uniref:Uncharacterized protein n=1 Tax=viral metagenome TaxID=1070528 RepID=A0A6C0K312_9ZZZZ